MRTNEAAAGRIVDAATAALNDRGPTAAEAFASRVLAVLDEVNPPRNLDEAAPRADGTVRKAHYGSGEQPWDVMVKLGIAPGFAAGCVLRYLRRDKEPEHSLSSARWYYARLVEMAAGNPGLLLTEDAQKYLGLLLSALTPDEAEKARGQAS